MTARAPITLVRAARELLGWNQTQLAKKARLGVATVRRYERGEAIQDENVETILRALSKAGIAFLDPASDVRTIRQGVAIVATGPTLAPIRATARDAKANDAAGKRHAVVPKEKPLRRTKTAI